MTDGGHGKGNGNGKGNGENGGDSPEIPEFGSIFEFRDFNEALASLDDRKELHRHPMMTDPDALNEWMGSIKAPDDLSDHINDDIGVHPLYDALSAGAWIALARSATDDIAPRFYLRINKTYRVVVGRDPKTNGVAVVVDVPKDWPHVPPVGTNFGSKHIAPDLIERFNSIEARGLSIDAGGGLLSERPGPPLGQVF